MTESELLALAKEYASQNEIFDNYIGLGYYNTLTPQVILRNIMENPGWYTQYTPYQAEISQGRLESLLNFQTMVTDLTGMDIANASLLDEGTAAAEAMMMAHAQSNGRRKTFFIDKNTFPQTIAVVKTRAAPFNVNVVVGDFRTFDMSTIADDLCGALVQYPAMDGTIEDFESFSTTVKNHGGLFVVASDLMALTLLKAPGEFGADICLGSTQRFGVPLGFGGPHAAFFATTDKLKRRMPGRLVGVSRDVDGNPALRLALQTREQHIRRERATSNICTAQALLANMAAMYAVYHGPDGLTQIAQRIHALAKTLAHVVTEAGHTVTTSGDGFFDTITIRLRDGTTAAAVAEAANAARINIRVVDEQHVSVSLDETTTKRRLRNLAQLFSDREDLCMDKAAAAAGIGSLADMTPSSSGKLTRNTPFLEHPVFNSYHSETEMLRYLHRLQAKDLSLTHAMIPLGSCTMKLNATSEMVPVTMPGFNSIHPFAPPAQAKGYQNLFRELEADLAEITGFDAVSLQPNSGANGEYAGLMAIRGYHESRGEAHRDVCLIPVSAHGTNPASAMMAGMRVVPVKCLPATGELDMEDLAEKAAKHADNLSCIMVTYPSTFGVFDAGIRDVCQVVHRHGGQVYLDGANMNAQVGICRPGDYGADVVHLNLHKTLCIPHGGGGPGMGPIGVKAHLQPFLPDHPLLPGFGGSKSPGPVASAPYSSASILPIPWAYIRMMGPNGLRQSTETAILNANYMAKRLEDHYSILYRNHNSKCAHEFIIDARPLKETSGIEAIDIAKRLQDYGFHSPTMSWPVVNTLMIEPTESESLAELDRLCDALIAIREEIAAIERGDVSRTDNALKRAPHTAATVTSDTWDRSYSRETAAFPTSSTKTNKFWPTTSRIDDTYGDLNLVCTCPPMESYGEA
ncbi:glycine dehydrogenase [Fonticula alba]|uniref:Glycine cleavage system P protein n=1 Tax=Fonticula alba TaxID=691883 RepID=A0A058ZC19_FONAL|nr:glycine dehydrogenase [Fonticula alba]KCV71468.1 glycine dehydrogenase [Fonticula alba]|eukprot:XP_009494591.1 glycine dehydrogenase [Fonticula alba]